MEATKYRGTKEQMRALSTFVKFMRASESLSARVHKHLAKEGLTISQFGVLEALYHLGPLSQREVAHKVLKTSGNLTLVVANLVKMGCVRKGRTSHDRRLYRLSLTPEGQKLMVSLFPRHADIIQRELAILTEEEKETLGRFCRAIGRKDGHETVSTEES